MSIILNMTEEELVGLYLHLSSDYSKLSSSMKKLLHKLEKELFRSLTISQIESLQARKAGDL